MELEQLNAIGSFECPPIAAAPPLASEFATEMTLHNIWGQMVLLEERADRMVEYYLSMSTFYQEAAMEMNYRRSMLEKALAKLKNADTLMNEMRGKLEKAEEGVSGLTRELNLLRRKPGLARMAGMAIPEELKATLDAPVSRSKVRPQPFAHSASTPTPHSSRSRVSTPTTFQCSSASSAHAAPTPRPRPSFGNDKDMQESRSRVSSAEPPTDTEADALEEMGDSEQKEGDDEFIEDDGAHLDGSADAETGRESAFIDPGFLNI